MNPIQMNMCMWIHHAQTQHDVFSDRYAWADWVAIMEEERHRQNMRECVCDTCIRVNRRKCETLRKILDWLRFCRKEKLDPAELQYRYNYYPSWEERNSYASMKQYYGLMMKQYLDSMVVGPKKKETRKETNWCLQCEVPIAEGMKYCGGDDCVCSLKFIV